MILIWIQHVCKNAYIITCIILGFQHACDYQLICQHFDLLYVWQKISNSIHANILRKTTSICIELH